jgi:hypothetical protein
MANRLILQRLDKITMVRKGKATAKHPALREGAIEVVKSYEAVQPWMYDNSPTGVPNAQDETLRALLAPTTSYVEGARRMAAERGMSPESSNPAPTRKADVPSQAPSCVRFSSGRWA